METTDNVTQLPVSPELTESERPERPYFRLSGAELIELINQGDEAALTEGANRKSKAVQAALANRSGEPVVDAEPLATITVLAPATEEPSES
jgi:hypothetical protein